MSITRRKQLRLAATNSVFSFSAIISITDRIPTRQSFNGVTNSAHWDYYVRVVLCPKTKRDNGLAVLKRIVSQIPKRLIIFDRRFNRKKVFATVLERGHHLLCRTKSNAVSYHLPTKAGQAKRGRRRTDGKQLQKSRIRFATKEVEKKKNSITSAIVHVKMCPRFVRLLVIRTKTKPSHPYRFFCVYTTNLNLAVETIVIPIM